MSDDEKIGEIKIEEQPMPLKGDKYLVYVRLPSKVDVDKLAEIVENAFDQYPWQPKYVEAFETKTRFPRDFEIFWKALAEVDKIEVPPYKYLLRLLSGSPADSTEEIEQRIADCLEKEGLVPENSGLIYVAVQKVILFPDEKPRVVKRIPLTRGMLKEALKKRKAIKNKVDAGERKDEKNKGSVAS